MPPKCTDIHSLKRVFGPANGGLIECHMQILSTFFVRPSVSVCRRATSLVGFVQQGFFRFILPLFWYMPDETASVKTRSFPACTQSVSQP